MTIINEDGLDVVDKTVQPIVESECHGRSVEGNRGRYGRRQKFEAFNIRLKVCRDDHGLFNGDDDCAAKGCGGREVLGALAYMKQHQPGEWKVGGKVHQQGKLCRGCRFETISSLAWIVFHMPFELIPSAISVHHGSGLIVPLTCAVDYHGFRVLAVAKVPTGKAVFTNTGKLRQSREDMVHGTPDGGATILNENRALNSKLQVVAENLNLSSHLVKVRQVPALLV